MMCFWTCKVARWWGLSSCGFREAPIGSSNLSRWRKRVGSRPAAMFPERKFAELCEAFERRSPSVHRLRATLCCTEELRMHLRPQSEAAPLAVLITLDFSASPLADRRHSRRHGSRRLTSRRARLRREVVRPALQRHGHARNRYGPGQRAVGPRQRRASPRDRATGTAAVALRCPCRLPEHGRPADGDLDGRERAPPLQTDSSAGETAV